jgi:hypothetical protein
MRYECWVIPALFVLLTGTSQGQEPKKQEEKRLPEPFQDVKLNMEVLEKEFVVTKVTSRYPFKEEKSGVWYKVTWRIVAKKDYSKQELDDFLKGLELQFKSDQEIIARKALTLDDVLNDGLIKDQVARISYVLPNGDDIDKLRKEKMALREVVWVLFTVLAACT